MRASGDPDDTTCSARIGRIVAGLPPASPVPVPIPILARMAAVLGIPEAAFSAPEPPGEVEARERAALLDLVRIHLREAGPEGRHRFAAALRAVLDVEAR